MAKGLKTGGKNFVKGQPGGPGRTALPPDLKEARALRTIEFEQIIYKYLDCSLDQLQERIKDKSTPAKELIVIKMLELGLKNGDLPRVNFLLERTIGRVPDKIEVSDAGGFQKLHDAIIDDIDKNEN